MEPNTFSVSPSSEVALVNDYPPIPFVNVKQMAEMLECRRTEIDETGLQKINYMSFGDVTPTKLVEIEKYRKLTGTHFRFTYFPDIATLIIKIPTRRHERSHARFFQFVDRRLARMGVHPDEFVPEAATTTKSLHRPPGQQPSQKEGDSRGINIRIRPSEDDWPSIVIESGVSESLPQLKADARWWIENSAGQVRIVILIKVNKANRNVRILKCVPRPSQDTSTRSNQSPLPPRMVSHVVTDIQIDQSVSPSRITGAPLNLEFAEVTSRQPVPPHEADIIFTAQDLDEWTSGLWSD